MQDLTEDEAILQALNRLGFGPRPGDSNASRKWACRNGSISNFIPIPSTTPRSKRAWTVSPRSRCPPRSSLDEFPQPQVAARREGVSLEEYRKEQQARMQGAMQANRTDGRRSQV